MKTNGMISDDSAKVLIADTLRLYVGLGRRISWADLAEATGDSERKLRSYVEKDGPLIPLDVFMRVFTVLPPEAFARVARQMGFTASPADIDETATVRRVMAKAARLVADGNEYLEDGHISPSERAKLADRAADVLPDLQFLADTGTPH